ncbi:hypothetical protein CRG98_042881 [Punica granatum]|uniref:Uncharacterized protein n=1 Tax=Punica granatum TaxID=22663 RepID=A0A2I0HYF5_PUNGR|nr:hypothetical protein CRG98_042881 [Punica granatum]
MRTRSPGTRSPSRSKCGREVQVHEVPEAVNVDAKSGDPKSLKEYMRRVPEGVQADPQSGDPKTLKQYMRTRSPGTRSP